jgi:hypothetical protein
MKRAAGAEPSGDQQRGNATMDPQRTSSRTAWAKTLRRCELIVMKASGPACKVFLALKLHANCDGYCWPLVSTLQGFTGIKKRDTIFAALRELEVQGIVYRRQLISRRGRDSPTLYRIGREVEAVPKNAAVLYVLGPARQKAGRRPAKRDLGDLACEVPPNGTTGVPSNVATEVPSNGATRVPPDGTQNYSREPLNGTASGEGAVSQVSLRAEGESSPNTQVDSETAAAFHVIGFEKPFGQPTFQEIWFRKFASRNGEWLTAVMEATIQECYSAKVGIPPQFFDAKHDVEKRENAEFEAKIRKTPL